MTHISKVNKYVFMAPLLAAIYLVVYVFVYKLPIIGTPTFRIDYFATTITRGDSLAKALLSSRPVSALYVYIQAIIATALLDGKTSIIIYPLQVTGLVVYFLAALFTIEFIFKRKVISVALISAWIVLIITPEVMTGIYKLETLVGTLSMLFGGISLLSLISWLKSNKKYHAILFILSYSLCLFSKVDFILPPLMLIAWYIYDSENWKRGLARVKYILLALAAIFVFFIVFNELIVYNHAFINPVDNASSPYFMSLNPFSLIKVAIYYSFDTDMFLTAILIGFLILSFISIIRRKDTKEIIFIFLIVAGLMAPYLIMPNHIFNYYSVKWIVWELITSFMIFQSLPVVRDKAVAFVTSISVILLTTLYFAYTYRKLPQWYEAAYFRNKMRTSSNMYKSLEKYKSKINSYPLVGVVGIGPKQIAQSPWQDNGETAFFLRGDLGLSPDWIVFVESPNNNYRISTIVQNASSSKDSNLEKIKNPVNVISAKNIDKWKNVPKIIFDSHGNATFETRSTNN